MVDLETIYLDYEYSVLIADDQRFMLKNLERYFVKFFKILTAASFEDAKNALENNSVAVVVSDHQMAEGDGLKLLEYVRDAYNATRRVVITGDRHEQLVIDMMGEDLAHSFVFKPTVKPQLHQAIAEQFEIYLRESSSSSSSSS